MASEEANQLNGLKAFTTVVADTGEFSLIEKYQPQDSTTNPSLLLAALKKPETQSLVSEVVAQVKKIEGSAGDAADRLAVAIGMEILKIVPGRVSTEVDARLSFNKEATLAKARHIIKLYEEAGLGDKTRERVLIKIASTWEGLQAAKELEAEGIHCNLTLMFAPCQAQVAGIVGAQLISPFVGRITDYYKKERGVDSFDPTEDPGVLAVQYIWKMMKQHYPKTEVMGASFRSPEQVLELAGCDLLTVSPALLEKLRSTNGKVARKLSADSSTEKIQLPPMEESDFRFALNSDAMAHFKLSEGIRKFVADQVTLEQQLDDLLKK